MRSTVVINQDLRPLRSRTRSLLNFMQYFHSCNPQSLLHLESHFSVGIYHDFGSRRRIAASQLRWTTASNAITSTRWARRGARAGPMPPSGSSPRYGQAVQLVEGDGTLDQALVSPLLKDLPRCTF